MPTFAIPIERKGSSKTKSGAIAQLVEQRTENPCVPGSIPGGTTENLSRSTSIEVFSFMQSVESRSFPCPASCPVRLSIKTGLSVDKDSKKRFIFFTNALTISPVMVAELCHNRWQIELFFKWIKQHLKIKKFWGTSENAVRIQIYSATIAYCMMAIVQK